MSIFFAIVFLGFGENDDNDNTYLDLGAGFYHWKFHFVLPPDLPASYYDGSISVAYLLRAVVDSPIIQSNSGIVELSHHVTIMYPTISDSRSAQTRLNLNR